MACLFTQFIQKPERKHDDALHTDEWTHRKPEAVFYDSGQSYGKRGREVAEALYDHASCYEQDIAQAMKDFHTEQYPSTDLMQYFSLSNKRLETAIKSKVLSAHPTVHVEEKILYAVLELQMMKDLTVEEFTSFVKQIARQYETGWGKKLEYHDIKAKNSDVVSIRLYHDNINFFTGEAFEKQVKRARTRRASRSSPER